FALFLVVTSIRTVNGFPALMARLLTSQPLQLQLAVLLASAVVSLAVQSATMALIGGAVPAWSPGGRLKRSVALTLGVALGAIASAFAAASGLSNSAPAWPSYAGATSFVPFLSSATGPVTVLLTRTSILTLVAAVTTLLTA